MILDFAQSPQLREDFRKNQKNVYLRRRPAYESTFPATLRALGSMNGALAEAGGGVDRVGVALGWVFHLDALKNLTRAERSIVLDRLGSGGGVGDGLGSTTAVDARLVLRAGLDVGSWSRDRLLGLRLLFEWAERRRVFAADSGPTSGSKQQSDAADEAAVVSKGKSKSAKGGRKTARGGKGKKKVSVGVGAVPPHDTEKGPQGERLPEQRSRDVWGGQPPWWLTDSAIEELKGRAWLAGREG
jgi:anaphase-promoting complex subunit 1